jgi:hypothetical protein
MHDIHDLDLLAKYGSMIFGRALDPSAVKTGAPLWGNRADCIDEHSDEICKALRALTRLNEFAANPKTKWVADTLMFARVRCGLEARRSGEVYLQLALALTKAPLKKFSPEKRLKLIAKGMAFYDKACVLYETLLTP